MTQAAMDNETMVEVTPEDRELVYGLLMPAARSSLQKLALEYIRDGKSDDADAVKQVARHRHQSGRTGAGEADPARILKNALFALERQKAAETVYGGVLTDDGRYAWVTYQLLPQGQRPALSQSTAGEALRDQWGNSADDPFEAACLGVPSQSTAGEDGA